MYCINYCGVACTNGLCPNSLDFSLECTICPYYKGCEDCAFVDTVLCKKPDERGEIMDIENIENIEVKYVKSGMEKLSLISNGDWIDLRVAEDSTLEKGDFKLIPLGIAIRLPKGYEALVIPRSSTFMKYGVIQANSCGLIDESYCGDNDEWMFPVFATRNTVIPKNTRVCQFRIIKHQPIVRIIEVNKLSDNNRGGFGSTGTN